MRGRQVPVGLVAAVTGAAALPVVAATVAAAADTPDPAMNALARGLAVAAPMTVGLYAVRVHQCERFARLLYATGAVACVTTLAETRDPTLYTVGRGAGWVVEALIVLLVLTYPTGWLGTWADRRIAGAVVATLAFVGAATLLMAETLPVPSPSTSCTAGCPSNVLSVVQGAPAAADALLGWPAALAVLGAMLAFVVRLEERMRTATVGTRRVLMPVVTVGLAGAALVGIGAVLREVDQGSRAVQVIALALLLWLPVLSLAFVAGLLRARLFAEHALRQLAQVVQSFPDARSLGGALREALEDATTRIVFPANIAEDRWVDSVGKEVLLTRGDPRQALYRVLDGDRLIAVIVYDGRALRPQLLEAVGGLAGIALDNERLKVQAEVSAREVNDSRARIAASADKERRRIERDLHDGAQQRLVALRIELGLLEELAQRDPERVVERLVELQQSAEDALDELRALAHGVCPPLLVDRGLGEALQAAVARCSTPTELTTRDVGRYPLDLETATYFCVVEALQNIDKHAHARRATVVLEGGGRQQLRFLIHDDGVGASQEQLEHGAGLTNMCDRVAAVGGHVRVTSSLRVGTTVRGDVPIPRGSTASSVTPSRAGVRDDATARSGS